MTKSTQFSPERAFVDWLEDLYRKQDRAALASLRRAAGRTPAEARYAWKYIVPRIRLELARDDYFLIAGLFATHPGQGGGSVGAVFRRMHPSHEHDSVEKRFVALLSSRRDDLSHHLASAVRLARSKEIPVDYERLFRDVRAWTHPDQYVQYRWAKEFWGSSGEPGDARKGE